MENREDSPAIDPAEDAFLTLLIDTVKQNPCIYNRYDPLHKVAEFKHEVWNTIARKTNFDGASIELERKWRHMRDKYVRLRKMDKLNEPIKKGSKWYTYYERMSFLDPYVEHRNRRKRDGEENEEVKIDFFKSSAPEAEDNTFEKNALYAAFLSPESFQNYDESLTEISSKEGKFPIHEQPSPSTPPPFFHAQSSSTPRKRKLDIEPIILDDVEPNDDSEVSLFVRSIAKSLETMDKRTFSIARYEIAKVLYNCQFGDLPI